MTKQEKSKFELQRKACHLSKDDYHKIREKLGNFHPDTVKARQIYQIERSEYRKLSREYGL